MEKKRYKKSQTDTDRDKEVKKRFEDRMMEDDFKLTSKEFKQKVKEGFYRSCAKEDEKNRKLDETHMKAMHKRVETIQSIQDGCFKEEMKQMSGFKKDPKVPLDQESGENLLIETISELNLTVNQLSHKLDSLINKKTFLTKVKETIGKFFRFTFW